MLTLLLNARAELQVKKSLAISLTETGLYGQKLALTVQLADVKLIVLIPANSPNQSQI